MTTEWSDDLGSLEKVRRISAVTGMVLRHGPLRIGRVMKQELILMWIEFGVGDIGHIVLILGCI